MIDCLVDIVSHGQQHHSCQSLLVCGDFNGLSDSVDMVNSLLGTTSLFNFSTRDSAQIDHALCDHPNIFKEAQRLSPLGKSDHALVFCDVSSVPPPPSVAKIQVRSKSPSGCANFGAELENSLFLPSITKMADVNVASNALVQYLMFLYNKHFPIKSVRVRSDDKPWVKSSLKLLINMRDNAYAKCKMVKYFRLRKAVIQHSQKLKSDFLLSATKTKNTFKLWRAIKKVVSQSSSNHVFPDPDKLKESFASVFEECMIPLSDFSSLPSQPLHISLDDVLTALKRLKNSSPGPDGLPAWLFRDHRGFLAPYIQHIFNLSVSTGVVPDNFKDAFVVPIPKIKSPSCEDFRPISMLPVLSKLLERIILRKWISPLVPNVGNNQFAFIPRGGQGTTVALTYVMNKVLSYLDTPGAVRLLMIDYSKAFDKLPHNTILNAFSSLCAPRELVLWLSSFLQHRRQCVKISNVQGDSALSDWYTASSGVPQGGVLSPILFAIAVDDLDVKFQNSLLVKYADDFCLLHFLRRNDDDRLQDEFDHIVSWSSNCGLTINSTKTKIMNFQTSGVIPHPLVQMEGSTIELVSSANLLGITISDNLSWKLHVYSILRKARKRIFLLYRLRQAKAPQHVLWLAYCAMLRSILSYSYPAWCNIGKGDVKLLTQFERRLCNRFDMRCDIDFQCFCSSVAKKLADKSLASQHPLHGVFDFLPSRFSSRLGNSYRKVFARTCRFKNSFIRFT